MTTLRIAFRLARPLPLLNRLLRSHWMGRSRERAALAWEIKSLIHWREMPDTPFRHATVTVTRMSVGRPDPDGLDVKHLLDVLQPVSKRHPNGLGVIMNDNDECLTLIRRAERVAHLSEQGTFVVIEGQL